MGNDDLSDLPFRAEYAKSSRASCKGCKGKIEKDHLRLAVMVQSPMFDGKVPNWYHFSCFFLKQRVKNVGDVSHFESLRWDDQEKIRKKVEERAGGSSSSSQSSSKAVKRKSNAVKSSGDFKIEYSKSSRAMCQGCEEKIIKSDVRVSKKDYESEEGRKYGGLDRWYHLDCFVKLRATLEFWNCGSQLPGYKSLKQEDQVNVKEVLPEIKPVKKEEADEEPVKKQKLSTDVLKKQNDLMYKYRDLLGTLPKKCLVELLNFNKQDIPEGNDRMLDRLADAMAFGSLKRCSVCKTGQLVFRSGCGYYCLGHTDEWSKCESVFDDPPRKSFAIPKDLKKEYKFLASYKCSVKKRVFEKNTLSTESTVAKSVKSDPSASGPKIERNLPLKRMEFTVVGKLDRNKEELKREIMKLGGVLGTKIHEMTTAVISTSETVQRKGTSIKSAEKLNIQVVPESFIEECKNGGDAISCINRLNLASWGADPTNRLSTEVRSHKSDGRSKSSRYKSSGPSKIKLLVKDGNAVDPASGLEDIAHVYRDHKNNVYNASLSLTDLQTGKNSYYKLQILESESKKKYWLFRAWGRIGTTIGGNKTEDLSRDDAIASFKTLFEERTANSWDNRKNFVKVPGKMVMMDICYDEEDQLDSASNITSKLEKPVQELIQLIFNVNLMKNVMKEMEIDLEKMPLGKLSKKQIQEAFKVLTKLQNCLGSGGGQVDVKTIISHTNQFFTLVPHDFGVDVPPLLDNLDIVKEKTELVDSLMEIEIAYSLMKKSDDGDEKISPIDSHYMKLNASMSVLSKDGAEFNIIKQYMVNTHAQTHRNYELEILEIFKVERHGEDTRYEPFRKLHNRKLLWHGSRTTNFAGILSQGLRIAPPEAPVTGYMFGKGIYFADMVSKSANYCMTSPANNTGLLLLCEVALGDMMELLNAQNIVKPPKGKHSVKGVGKTQPDPQKSKIMDDGVEIPLGPAIPSDVNNTSLLYNEYIVYDVAQVKVKYLIQTKFNFCY